MKFISKNSNLRIVLEPGLPAQPLSGMPAKPTVFVKFTDGIAEVRDPELIKKMINHSGFEQDFIAVDEQGEDPFAASRQSTEPIHLMTEMQHGSAKRVAVGGGKTQLPPEIQKAINDLAMAKVKELLPAAIEGVLKQYAEGKKEAQVQDAVDGVETDEEVVSPKLEEIIPDVAKNVVEFEQAQEVAAKELAKQAVEEEIASYKTEEAPSRKKSVLDFLKK